MSQNSSNQIAVDRAQFNTLSSIQDQIIIIENNVTNVTNTVNNLTTNVVTDTIHTTDVITQTITTSGDINVGSSNFVVNATNGNITSQGGLTASGVVVCEDVQTTGTHPISSLNDIINTLNESSGSLVGLQNQINTLDTEVAANTTAITNLGTSITTGAIHSSSITNTGSLAAGSTVVSSLASSGAISGTTGTFSGSVSSAGLASSSGLIVSSGSSILGATTTGALTSTSGSFSAAVSTGGVTSSNGLTVSVGTSNVQALNAGSTSVTSFTNTGNETIGGNLNVTGATTLSNTLKLPSFTTSQMNAISSPANGMIIYNSSTNSIYAYQNSVWSEVNSSNGSFSGTVSVGSLTATSGITVSGGTTAVQALTTTGVTNSGNETISGTLSAGATTVTSLTNSGSESITGNLAVNTNKFTVAAASGNTVIAGTLAVTGATTLSSTLTAGATTVSSITNSGSESISGNLAVNTNKFTVDSSTGNTLVAGTLGVTGTSTLGTITAGSTTVTSLTNSGNETITGTLGVSGTSTLGTVSAGSTTVTSLTNSGNETITGTLGVTGTSTLGTVSAGSTTLSSLTNTGTSTLGGNVAVAINKFTVNSSSGNTAVAGTLTVGGASTLAAVSAGSTNVTSLTNSGAEAISGNLSVNTDRFTVDSSTGNTAIAGTLAVTGTTTLGATGVSSLINSGNQTISGNLTVGGNITANGSTITSNSIINEYNYMSITQNPADGTHPALSISQGGTASGPILQITDSDSSIVFDINQNCDINLNAGKFTVAASSGNMGVAGTLSVTGATTMGATLTLPTYTTTQMNAISSPVNGMVIYNSTASSLYAYEGGAWSAVGSGGGGGGTFSGPISAPGITSSAGLTVSSGSTSVQDITATSISTSGVSTLSGNTTIGGTLGVTGATTLSSTLSAGATTVSSLTDSGNATVGGTLGVTGATTLSSTLSAGATTVSSLNDTGNATIGGTLGVTGTTTLAATNISSLSDTGNATIGGTLGVTGATTLSSTLSAGATTISSLNDTGNATVGGTLGVTGATTLSSTLGVTGATTLSSTLSAGTTTVSSLIDSGNATVGGTLGVTGATTLSSTLSAGATTISSLNDTGNATVGGTLGVTGATTLSSTLGVTGAATLSSTLSAGATTVSSLNDTGNATIGGTLGVTGATTLSGTLSAGATTVSSLNDTGNATIGGTLGVTGATTLSGTLSAGATTISSLNDTGNATVGGTLGVTGTSTLAALTSVGIANINVTGTAATNIGNTTGNTAVTGNLAVSGNTTSATSTVTSTSLLLGNVNFTSMAYNANSATSGSVLDASGANTSIILPKGTTGQRPTGTKGMLRYNTTSDSFEGYSGSSGAWGSLGSGGGGSGLSQLGTASYTGWNVGTQKKLTLSTPLQSTGAHVVNVVELQSGSNQTDRTWSLTTNPNSYDFYNYRGTRGNASISSTTGLITITLSGSDVWSSADLFKAFTDGTGYATILSLITTKIAQASVTATFSSSGSKSAWYLYLGTINSNGNFSLVNALASSDIIMTSSLMPNRAGINDIQNYYYNNAPSGFNSNPTVQWGNVYYMDVTYYPTDKIIVGFIGGTFYSFTSVSAIGYYITHNLIVSYDGGSTYSIPYPANTIIYPYGSYRNITTGSGDGNNFVQQYYSQGPLSTTYSAGYAHLCYMSAGQAYNTSTNNSNQLGAITYVRMTVGTAPAHSTKRTIASLTGQEAGSSVNNSMIGYPKIMVTNSGVLYVIYQDSSNSSTAGGRMWFSISSNNGGSWSQPAQISTGLTSILANVFLPQSNQNYQQYYPMTYSYDCCTDSQFAASITNNLYYVVVAKAAYNSSFYQIYFGYFSSGTSTYSNVATPISGSSEFSTSNCSLPHIYSDQNAKLHAIFFATSTIQGTGMFYAYSTNTGTTWSSPVLITTDALWYKCRFIEKPNGVLNLLYNNNGSLVYYTLDNSTTWYNKTNGTILTLENYDIARMTNYPSLTPQFTTGDLTGTLYDNDYMVGAINMMTSTYQTYSFYTSYASGYYSYNYGFKEDTTKRKWNITKRINDFHLDYDYTTSFSTNNQYTPKMLNYNNVLYLVWSGTTTGLTTRKIYISTSSNRGQTWTVPTRVSNLGTTYAEQTPDIIIDGSGLIHVAFSGLSSYDPTYYQIFYQNSTNGTTWTSSYNISQATGYIQNYPVFALGATNQVFLFWQGQGVVSSVTAYRIYFAYNTTANAPNGGWISSGSPIFGSTYSPYAQTLPKAIYSGGIIYLIWISNSTSSTTYKKLYFAYNDTTGGIGATWVSDATKPAGDYSSGDVKVGAFNIDLTGKIHVLYSAGSNGQYVYATYTSNNGGTWSPANKRSSIKSESVAATYPFTTSAKTLSVHVDSAGYVHFTFIGGNAFNTYDYQTANIANDTSAIYHSYTDNNGTTYKGMKPILTRVFGLSNSGATQAENQISVTSIGNKLYVICEAIYSIVASNNSLYLHEYTDQDVKFGCLYNASTTYNTSDLYAPLAAGHNYNSKIGVNSNGALWVTGQGTSSSSNIQMYAWYSTNSGQTWVRYLANDSSNASINQNNSTGSNSMLIDSSNNLYVLWCGNNSTFSNTTIPRLFYNRFQSGGSSFDTSILVDTTTGSNLAYAFKGCDITINQSNTLYASYNRAVYLGLSTTVYTVCADHIGNIYVGGEFTTAGGNSANYIAKWNGSNWSALGTGMNGAVYALCVDSSNNVYAGGAFSLFGGISNNFIAKWNGSAWVGTLGSANSTIYCLTSDVSNNIYAGGSFTSIGGTSCSCIAKWNGSSWTSLSSSTNSTVYAMCTDSAGNLYAGGGFTVINSTSGFGYVGKWNGSSWSNMNGGLIGSVFAICSDSNNNIYAGGAFTTANGGSTTVNYIAKWNGTSWSAMGIGLNSSCYGLVCDSSNNVYASGNFTTAGGLSVNYLAKYNGTSWSALGYGANTAAGNLGIDSNNILYVASNNAISGGGASYFGNMSTAGYLGVWNTTSNYWIVGSPGSISYQTYVSTLTNGSSVWTTPVLVSTATHFTSQSRIKCDASNNIHLVYSAMDSVNNASVFQIWYSKQNSGSSSWSAPIQVSTYQSSTATSNYLDMQVYNGYVYVIYSISGRLYVSYKTIAGSSFSHWYGFTTDAQQTGGTVDDDYPSMYLYNNMMHIVCQGRSNEEQYYRKLHNSSVDVIKYYVYDLNETSGKIYSNSTIPFNNEAFATLSSGNSQTVPHIIVDTSGVINIVGICYRFDTIGSYQKTYHTRALNANSVKTNTFATAISDSTNGLIDSTGWTSVDSLLVNQDLNAQTAYYAVSITDSSTYEDWYVFNTSGAYRRIVHNNISGSTFQINNNSTFGSETLYTSSNTSIWPVLEEAMGYSANIMTGATVDSVMSSSLSILSSATSMRFAIIIQSSASTLNPEVSGATVQYTIPDYYKNTSANYSVSIINLSLVGVTPTNGSTRSASVYVLG